MRSAFLVYEERFSVGFSRDALTGVGHLGALDLGMDGMGAKLHSATLH